jgi:hypothetical protein
MYFFQWCLFFAVCAVILSPVEGLIYMVLRYIMKRPPSLLITIPAACLAIVLAIAAAVMWDKYSDSDSYSDKPTDERKWRELPDWDSASISRVMNMKKWECGPKSAPWAVRAALKKGTLFISGKGEMKDFFECRCLICPKYEYVGATLEKDDSTSDTDPIVIDIGRGYPMRQTDIPCCINAWAPWYMSNFADSITAAVVKNGVTYIGHAAFVGLPNLKSISIPASVDSIYWDAHGNAISCCSVRDPSECGDYNLESITVAAGNARYSSVDGVLYNKDTTTLILYPSDKQQDAYTIPNSVTEIGERAFIRTRLKSVTIPSSVTAIGKDAFAYSGLTSVTVPSSVAKIEHSTFAGCVGLASAAIEEGVTSIGTSAFHACTSLTSIKIPRTVTSIESGAFALCRNLTSFTTGEDVTSVGMWTFYNCVGLTSVTFSNGVTSIGNAVFDGCKNLKTVTILNPVPLDITNEPFYGISPNVRLYVPKGSLNAYRRAWRHVWNEFERVSEINGD